MTLFISLIKFYLNQMLRRLFWLYKLSISELGSGIQLEFPIIREGRGDLKIGNNSYISKNVNFGIDEKSILILGSNSKINNNAVILVNKNCSFTIGNDFILGEGTRCYVKKDWKFGNYVKIETNCSIFGRESEKSGKLNIGNNSSIGDYTIIDVVDDIYIGNDVAIGPNSTLYTHDHIYTDKNVPAWKGGLISKPIIIEDGAWVGSGVTILPGVTIGKRAVIAAGSVVTKNVESNSIYGGIPAKFIKTI
ncbi:MAG: DapH/DapD/GlmU-related protein [Gelidibacter sp.]